MRTLESKFRSHRSSAARRGIPFELTFDEWLEIWEKSGHLAERGRRNNQYVMARARDQGSYTVGNVSIITFEQNCRDRKHSIDTLTKLRKARQGRTPMLGKKQTVETRNKISAALIGREFTVEHREKIRRANLGKKHTAESKAKMSRAKIGNHYRVGAV